MWSSRHTGARQSRQAGEHTGRSRGRWGPPGKTMNYFDSLDNRKLFREAMAHLSAAVNIITTDGPHGRCGMTASAVCSVTDHPPPMLVCVNQSSAAHAVFEGNGRICINVLPGNQQELARHFAGMTRLPMN